MKQKSLLLLGLASFRPFDRLREAKTCRALNNGFSNNLTYIYFMKSNFLLYVFLLIFSTQLSLKVHAQQVFTTCSGSFDDGSGAANYPNYFYGSWLISPTGAGSVVIDFTTFDIEGGYDYVNVYDGIDNTAPVLWSGSGYYAPFSLTSTGGNVFIEFGTDGSVTYPGWSLTYNCLIDSLPTPIGIVTQPLCAGNLGSIDVTINGGTAPYTYSWSNGATTQDISNLLAGTYILTITDSIGTIATGAWTINTPSPLTITSSVGPALCPGGGDGYIDVWAAGGTIGFFSDYNYVWSNGLQCLSCNGNYNLGAGTYSVVVSDDNGCTITDTFMVTEPAPITVSNVVVTDVLCAYGSDGTIQMDISGGTGNYEVYFPWPNSYNGPSPAIITGLPSGLHPLEVLDANGCYTYIGDYFIDEPAEIYVNGAATFTDILCYGDTGSISLDVVGGTLPYQYLWTNGDTTALLITADGSVGYDLTITDAHGCQTVWGTQYFNNPSPLTITSSVGNVSCAGIGDGYIDVFTAGGTINWDYNYDWSNGLQCGGCSGNYNLGGGTYTVVVSDDNGCTITDTFMVTEPAPIVVTLTSGDTTFCGSGIISGNTVGGAGGYSYDWNGWGASQNPNFNCADGSYSGSYTLSVTDSTGCMVNSNTINVTVWDSLYLFPYTTYDVICFGSSTDMYSQAGGGSNYYDITWTPAYIEGTFISPATTTTYTITLSDSLASVCGIITDSLTITVNPLPNVNLGADTAICVGNNIVLNATPSAGTSPFSYTWSNGAPNAATQTITPALGASYYNVNVADANGCTGGDTIQVTVNSVPNTPNVTVNGYLLTSSGTNVTWQWYLNGVAIAGATSQSYTAAQNGNYTVVTTNLAGCSSEISAPVNITGVAIADAIFTEIKVYPNPVNNELNILWEEQSTKSLQVILTDISGKMLFSKEINRISQGENIRLEIGDFATGVYFLRIQGEGKTFLTKIIKE